MSYLHHDPTSRSDGEKLRRRIDRFRQICQHTREVRGARPAVFIRYLHDSSEFDRIEELYSLLRLWAGGRVRLCIVAPHQIDDKQPKRLYRHPHLPRVLYWMCGFIDVMDFEPFREICQLAVHDEAGLLSCDTMNLSELPWRKFRDPYTTESPLCKEGDWLTALQSGQDPSFFPDCPQMQRPWQSNERNANLFKAVSEGDLQGVLQCLPAGRQAATERIADPNTWDVQGMRPLHVVGHLEKKEQPTAVVVRIASSLLLAHGDPRCRNCKQISAFEYAKSNGASPAVVALLGAASMLLPEPSEALHNALELVGEPQRSKLACMLAVEMIRPLGEAEKAWRNPRPDSEAFIADVEETLLHLERQPEELRKKEMKRLLLEWHPDKNSERHELATSVFQYLQANKGRVVNR
eukprot:TRINITY_DN15975_c0_g2_i2.p1 TRINITY_DN15975_c0_g2~~TRINITY_DN15975_c0_g2_i2.p1  ORF type:complete len:407 (-),score=57.36 TRINITY_DN15975_c0_g2_i2:317-1537(-)